MPVEMQARCLRCHMLKPHRDFPVIMRTFDPKTHKRRVVYDVYCNDCKPHVTVAQRKADQRDPRPPDR